MDELDLGLPPSTKRKRAAPGSPRPNRSWTSYRAKNRQMCAACVQEVETVNGWPVRAIERASFMEHGPDGNVPLCAIHKQEREAHYTQEGT